jgi:hypothetical protein
MADKSTNSYTRLNVVPFTGGLLMLIYAFFWPEGYGAWLGTIVKSFRNVSGI